MVDLICVGICGLCVCWVIVRVSWFYGLVRLVSGCVLLLVCFWFVGFVCDFCGFVVLFRFVSILLFCGRFGIVYGYDGFGVGTDWWF